MLLNFMCPLNREFRRLRSAYRMRRIHITNYSRFIRNDTKHQFNITFSFSSARFCFRLCFTRTAKPFRSRSLSALSTPFGACIPVSLYAWTDFKCCDSRFRLLYVSLKWPQCDHVEDLYDDKLNGAGKGDEKIGRKCDAEKRKY